MRSSTRYSDRSSARWCVADGYAVCSKRVEGRGKRVEGRGLKNSYYVPLHRRLADARDADACNGGAPR